MKDKVRFVRKIIGAGSGIVCLLMLFLKFISYTSTSTVSSDIEITWTDNISVFSFLFNKDYEVFDCRVEVLRDIFGFSYVIMWISFILILIGVVTLIVGVFVKKSLISKIGSIIVISSLLLLILIAFDVYKSGITVRYLDVFTWAYPLSVFVGGFGVFNTIILKDDNK